jgi:cytochrome c oxidase cbb3-type subunit III
MKKLFPSYVRIPLIFTIVLLAIEYMIDSGDKPAFIKFPIVGLFLLVFFFLLVAIDMMMSAVEKMTYNMLSEAQKKEADEEASKSFMDSKFYHTIMSKLTKSKKLEESDDILLDHDYDGIKELDNVLPPWWVGLFYACIIFSAIYIFKYHFSDGLTQEQELEQELKIAQAEVDEYKSKNKSAFDVSKLTILTDAASLAEGKTAYETSCVACHKADGGGSIGPNLTDEHWILGGGIKNVFNTIMEGGREGKGMVPWKTTLGPEKIQKIASYVLSMQGTNPAGGKPAEGDKWVEEVVAVAKTDTTTVKKDSIK